MNFTYRKSVSKKDAAKNYNFLNKSKVEETAPVVEKPAPVVEETVLVPEAELTHEVETPTINNQQQDETNYTWTQVQKKGTQKKKWKRHKQPEPVVAVEPEPVVAVEPEPVVAVEP